MSIKKILVVDDEASIHAYLQRKLTQLGYEVQTAADGEAALKIAFEFLPDIVLLDVKLPKLDGLEVCRRLRSNHSTRKTPVLMLSAKAQSEEVTAGLEAGADRYLTKPISFPDILKEIETYNERER